MSNAETGRSAPFWDAEFLAGLRQDWIGPTSRRVQTLDPMQAELLAATLEVAAETDAGAALPPLWHCIYFPDATPSSALGADGTSRQQALLPPVGAPEVLWAGLSLEVIKPLMLGEQAVRTSRVTAIEAKTGRGTPKVFVTTEHQYEQSGQLAMVERNQAVFLSAGIPGNEKLRAAVETACKSEPLQSWRVDETVLFRFSALTFNAHRIHYDRRYTTELAGYRNLLVHGPLQALLMCESFRSSWPDRVLRSARFRACQPLYCAGSVLVRADPTEAGELRIWTQAGHEGVAMDGHLSF